MWQTTENDTDVKTMADYVIGDVQGCYDALMALRKKINFKPDRDRLYFWVIWLTGVVNHWLFYVGSMPGRQIAKVFLVIMI